MVVVALPEVANASSDRQPHGLEKVAEDGDHGEEIVVQAYSIVELLLRFFEVEHQRVMALLEQSLIVLKLDESEL